MPGNIEKINPFESEGTPPPIPEDKTEEYKDSLEIDSKVRELLKGTEDPKEMTERVISKLKYYLEFKDEIKEKTGLDFGEIEESFGGLEDSENKDEFVRRIIPILSEFKNLQSKLEENNNPLFRKISERIKRKAFVSEDEKFTSVDDEDFISYNTSRDKTIHMHVAYGHEFDEIQRYTLMVDGLIKLAEIAKENKSPAIEGTSYANLIKKYSEVLEHLGFTLAGEISEEERKRYFSYVPEDTRIHRVYIEKEKFDDLIDKLKKIKKNLNENKV